ncbi:hypothetical protein OG21DRAFT_1525465 [Imleria badia]|nr:hypothetical protein OG21DRAFT_1525465 [Imleria badia]
MNTANPTLSQSIAYVRRLSHREFAERGLRAKRLLSKVTMKRWIFDCTRIDHVSDIELRTQAPRKLLVARQHYIEFSVGNVTNSLCDQSAGRHAGKDVVSDLSTITIKFALAAQRRSDANTDERQAADAVTAATRAANPLSTPIAVGILGSAVDTTTNVVTIRMEFFNNIVTAVAQVHPYSSLAWSVISAANQLLIDQKHRNDQIIRLAGTMSNVFAFVHDAEPLKAIKAHIKTITLLSRQDRAVNGHRWGHRGRLSLRGRKQML